MLSMSEIALRIALGYAPDTEEVLAKSVRIHHNQPEYLTRKLNKHENNKKRNIDGRSRSNC